MNEKHKTQAKKSSQKFQDMMTKIDTLLRDMDQPDLDLDELIDKVDLGYQLIDKMQKKLEETKLKIEKRTK